MRFTPATIAAVRGIQLAPVASALPAGLPTEMLREVLVVYGDLASRTDAFNGVQMYGSPGRQLLTGSPQAQSALRGLRNGTPAAARFNSDLAAARTLAQQTPLVTIAAPDSRAALELALRLQSISLRNSCGEEFGGYAPTSLETIIWQPGTDQLAPGAVLVWSNALGDGAPFFVPVEVLAGAMTAATGRPWDAVLQPSALGQLGSAPPG